MSCHNPIHEMRVFKQQYSYVLPTRIAVFCVEHTLGKSLGVIPALGTHMRFDELFRPRPLIRPSAVEAALGDGQDSYFPI